LVGCSIHPLPEDVTRKTTFDIVQAIRCEAGRAVVDVADLRGIDGAIAYEFTFDITEINNIDSGITFTYPFVHGGQFSLGATADLDRTRQAKRNFRILDTFDALRAAAKKPDCASPQLEKNWVYPIAGDIGIYEVVATFARLAEVTTFGQPGTNFGKSDNGVYTFGDTLTFTTELDGELHPKLMLSPVTGKFRVTEAHLDLKADRKDMHEVVVALAGGKKPKGAALRGAALRGAALPAPPLAAGPSAGPRTNGLAVPLVVAPLGTGSSTLTTTLIQNPTGDAAGRALLELDRQRIIALQARTPNLLAGP